VRFGVVTVVLLKLKYLGADYSCVAGQVVSELLLRSFRTLWNVGNCVLSDTTSWPRRF